jgi:hypothetical protein
VSVVSLLAVSVSGASVSGVVTSAVLGVTRAVGPPRGEGASFAETRLSSFLRWVAYNEYYVKS